MRMAGRWFYGSALVGVLSVLGGCATVESIAPQSDAIAVNPNYQAGRVDVPTADVPSLNDLINRAPSRKSEASTQEDRLRGSAMKDGAEAYGARGGLASESRLINEMLKARSADISRSYNFQQLMIKGPDNVMIQPPVISEARQNWESSEAGKTLRVADTVYEIIDQAKFSPVAPTWQSYLIRDYKSPEAPPDILLPRDGDEREQWKRWVTEGWEAGRAQAAEIFGADLERLDRDFLGMVRYRKLLEENKVSAPVVANAQLGTTGTGLDMRENDRAIKITQDPSLQVTGTPNWSAAPTTPGADGRPTGNTNRPTTTPIRKAGTGTDGLNGKNNIVADPAANRAPSPTRQNWNTQPVPADQVQRF